MFVLSLPRGLESVPADWLYFISAGFPLQMLWTGMTTAWAIEKATKRKEIVCGQSLCVWGHLYFNCSVWTCLCVDFTTSTAHFCSALKFWVWHLGSKYHLLNYRPNTHLSSCRCLSDTHHCKNVSLQFAVFVFFHFVLIKSAWVEHQNNAG